MSPRGERASHSAAPGRAVALLVTVLLVYMAGAILSWQLLGAEAAGPAFFPPAGVTVAAMLLARRSLWPAVVAAVMVGELLIDMRYGQSPRLAAGLGLANAVEPLVGASLTLAWCGGPPDLRRRADLARFVAAACLAGPLVGGLIGGGIITVNFGVWFPAAVLHWTAGDGVGVLVIAVPILLWAKQSHVLRERPVETAAMLGSSAALSAAAFATTTPPAMVVLPVLAWAASRLNMIGAALSGAVIAFTANLLTSNGRGAFADLPVPAPTRLALAQAFIAVSLIVALLTAQEVNGRTAALRARESERRERLRLQTLAGLAQQLSAALTPEDIGRAVADQVLDDAGSVAFNLGVVSADGDRLNWVIIEGYPPAVVDEFADGLQLDARAVASDTARDGQPILIRTAEEYARRYPDRVHWLDLSGAQAVVGWPLTSGATTIGALLLVWTQPQPLDPAQVSYVSAVATMVSQALVRARLYADDHARTAVLQAAVLPSSPADTSGLDVAISYEPADLAQGLGGDWYDVVPLPKGRTYFAVGDVVGHGLQAVEDMAQLRSAARALAYQGLPPARLLEELNGFTRHASLGKFATMAVAIFEPAAAALCYCTAGHPPPLLRRAGTGEVIRLADAGGPVLGPVPDAGYVEGRMSVVAGDILVLYTDGLVERRGTDIDAGIARAQHIIAGWDPDAPLSGHCDRLQESLAPRPGPDDICIIAVRFADDDGSRADETGSAG